MGIYDRDYVFQQQRSRPKGLSVTLWLIIINVAVALFATLVGRPQISPGPPPIVYQSLLHAYGNFSTADLVERWEVWRLITFQFLHADLLHLAFNMYGLWIFGQMVEEYLGSKKYLAFYLVTGIFGAIFYLLLNLGGFLSKGAGISIPFLLVNDWRTPLIGASAGVFGVILAAAYIAPTMQVQLLLPPIPMKLRTLAYAFIIVAAATVLFRWKNAGGEAAHIGGALAGAFFIRRNHLLLDFFDVFGDSRKQSKKPPTRSGPAVRTSPTKADDQRAALDGEVDRILAKVSAEGIQSLSEREKSTLQRATSGANRGKG